MQTDPLPTPGPTYIGDPCQGLPKMTWTPEHRRRYAPALDHTVRTNAVTRLAAPIDAIDPPCAAGRPRLWSTLVMLQALWWLCRAGAAWKLLPEIYPPRQAIGSRLERWVEHDVLERALAVLDGCLRLAKDRKSTRLNSSHAKHLVCRFLLEKKNTHSTC